MLTGCSLGVAIVPAADPVGEPVRRSPGRRTRFGNEARGVGIFEFDAEGSRARDDRLAGMMRKWFQEFEIRGQ